ncbi:cytochrome C554 [Ruegeria marisrubri]|uniref:Cytochrome C554 n=1 Tax=Ruegeria marisrubri TaxID=1685379 RepID=A0A0X3TMU0_9RHOB|nr:cytochrome c [Ruegeria marisrubri]KUJ77058.1 cytochrome C554 [Ruegeria marisrubri]
MTKIFLMIAISIVFGAGVALAQDYGAALKARQGQMRLLALNLGILGGMAKGERDYDAALAQAAADNIVAVAALNQLTAWPEGSDMGATEGTKAKTDIWTDFSGFQDKWRALAPAAAKLQAAAGQGAGEIGAALGPVGGTCKGCHDTYRAPQS